MRSTFLGFAWTCMLSTVFYAFSCFLLDRARKKKTGVECKICGYSDSILFYPAKKKKHAADTGSFACSSFDHAKYPDIYFCPECKNGFLIQVATSKDETLKTQTQDAYKNVVDHQYLNIIGSRYKTYDSFLETYGNYFRDKTVLEVGCYYGAFLDRVKLVAKSYTGLEPSVHACNYLKEKYPSGVEIINGPVESLTGRNEFLNHFDTIVMFDVIEHLSNPIETLKQLHPFLKPGGTIMFSTINIESSFSIALGPFWPWFMDMHYYYFSDRGYQTMLYRSGYVMQKHAHFPYFVSFDYFVTKVLSILGFGSGAFAKKLPQFHIPIKLGDTVLTIGKKVS